MAILNETAIMTTVNWYMIVLGVFAICGGIGLSYVAKITKSMWVFSFSFFVAIVLAISGVASIATCNRPEVQMHTGKVTIEATFAKGEPSAYILEKYDVIGRDGKVWTLRTKPGVKEEKRAEVYIQEVE